MRSREILGWRDSATLEFRQRPSIQRRKRYAIRRRWREAWLCRLSTQRSAKRAASLIRSDFRICPRAIAYLRRCWASTTKRFYGAWELAHDVWLTIAICG